jgi:hypothetical protein
VAETTADAVIAALGLEPHPEGGHFREVYRHAPADGGRGDCTSIYYLLRAGERSAWHRVTDAVEVWQFHAGDPLALAISTDGTNVEIHLLGVDLAGGARPQAVVPAGAWQSAESRGDWTLVGCTVAPAFLFESFEMAPDGWEPG